MQKIDIYSISNPVPGWAPITTLERLIARLFDGDVFELAPYPRGHFRRILDLRPRRRGHGHDLALAVLHRPSDIRRLRRTPGFRDRRYRSIIAWIVDSQIEERGLSKADFSGIDLICITRQDEFDYYRRLLGERVLALHWGADVLAIDYNCGNRPIDLLRVGRQPAIWDNDEEVGLICSERGLRFQGRPPLLNDSRKNHEQVVRFYSQAKFSLAQTNLVSGASYTHKEKEYVTGRWTDALASGCIVAGVPPRNDATYREIFWPGATLEFPDVDLERNLEMLQDACKIWSPRQADLNRLMALERLDWRHCIKRIADHVSVSSSVLDQELSKIASLISDGKAALDRLPYPDGQGS